MRLTTLKRGFSLVEVLVTLAITSMLVGVLMGALFQLFKLQDSLTQSVARQEQDLQALAWWRGAVEGMIVYDARYARRDEKRAIVFHGGKGSALEFKFETSAALDDSFAAAPVIVSFSVKPQLGEGGVALSYLAETAGDKTAKLHRFDAERAEFQYFDEKGQSHAQWPPANNKNALAPNLVALRLFKEGRERVFLASPKSATFALPEDPPPIAVERL